VERLVGAGGLEVELVSWGGLLGTWEV